MGGGLTRGKRLEPTLEPEGLRVHEGAVVTWRGQSNKVDGNKTKGGSKQRDNP